MNIIFLDVDGVLNSAAHFEPFIDAEPADDERYEISDYHLQMLAEIYHACDAQIVLSSSWRTLNDRMDARAHAMYQYLVDSLARYRMTIMSQTPVIGMNRPLEIATWLNSQADREDIRFVSLDDDFQRADYDKYGIGHCLIRTQFFGDKMSEGGLQKRHMKWAIRKLKWNPVIIRILAAIYK